MRTNPQQMRLVELLAMAQDASGANRDAVRTLNALIVREPQALEPLLTLARVQSGQSDFDGAAATLVRALEKAPYDANVARELIGAYLKGTGRSTAELLGSSDGGAVVVMSGGKLSNLLLEIVGIDIAEALGFVIGEDKPVAVRCAVADFKVTDGVLKT